jgi:hypothetical protein
VASLTAVRAKFNRRHRNVGEPYQLLEVADSMVGHNGVSMKLFLYIAFMLLVLPGCDSDQTVRDNLMKQTSSLYGVYLAGTQDEARRSIQEANRLIENAKLSPQFEQDRAYALFLGYARLYSLERGAGNNNVAQAGFIKARYWCLRSSELHGDSPSDCITYVEKFATEEKLLAFIKKWDRDTNHGKDPRYIQSP